MMTPSLCICAAIAAGSICVRKPGMLSSLSSVPPVCPRPRPLTIGTGTPQAATSGASTSEILSPTPPVECLSAATPSRDQSKTRPEWRNACVSASVSPASRPRRNAAMSQALAW